jgi:hypothetical protein
LCTHLHFPRRTPRLRAISPEQRSRRNGKNVMRSTRSSGSEFTCGRGAQTSAPTILLLIKQKRESSIVAKGRKAKGPILWAVSIRHSTIKKEQDTRKHPKSEVTHEALHDRKSLECKQDRDSNRDRNDGVWRTEGDGAADLTRTCWSGGI